MKEFEQVAPLAATHLEVAALGLEPVLDVALRISGEAEHEVPLNLQLVDGLDGLVDLTEEQRQVETESEKPSVQDSSVRCYIGGRRFHSPNKETFLCGS